MCFIFLRSVGYIDFCDKSNVFTNEHVSYTYGYIATFESILELSN